MGKNRGKKSSSLQHATDTTEVNAGRQDRLIVADMANQKKKRMK
jgi:hypothetical protein